MKSPWKFISNLTSRRRADDAAPEETPVAVTDVPQLPAPTPQPVEEVTATEAPDTAEAAPVAVEPSDDDGTNNAQDHVETEAMNQAPSTEDQSPEPVPSEEPINEEDVAVEATKGPAITVPAPQQIDAIDASIAKVEVKEGHREPPPTPVANDLVLAAVQDTPVVRSSRKTTKRQVPLPADQQFLLNMNAVDADIKQLKQALAEKLREQNAQLQSLIDRY